MLNLISGVAAAGISRANGDGESLLITSSYKYSIIVGSGVIFKKHSFAEAAEAAEAAGYTAEAAGVPDSIIFI
jgi:hypothetical protein